jgi:simple sugar transport system ATP-binding protein
MELSDRIAVIYRGELVDTVDGRSANREKIGLLMATGRATGTGIEAQPEAVQP